MCRTPRFRAAALLLASLLGSCQSPPVPLPAGAGLLAADLEAPSGAELFERPVWTPGDWYDFRRGGRIRLRYLVQDGPAGAELLDPDSGRTLAFDADLSQLGERPAATDAWSVQLDPLDPTFSWPLWPGKRWSGSFTRRGADGVELPLIVHYECDAIEEIRVPAGTFRALRIWRRSSPALEGEFIDRVSIAWYAPEVGYLVQRVDEGIKTQLEGFHRQ